ncbi:MAG TPA: phospholipase D-like domain-containing protein, partial [Bdellovibrionota bacterium]|nr:phospholipase D-like domain-containing protein [Bdellovibrionota bacterium]
MTLLAWLLLTPSHAADSVLTPELRQKLTELSGEKFTQGNDLRLLVNGTEFYPERLKMIREARRNIDILTFLWADDDAGLQIARELVKAAAPPRRIRVRVIVDFFNSPPHSKVYATLRAGGIEPLIFNPPRWNLNLVQQHAHEKIMVVDGEKALVGGANLCDEYMTGVEQKLWHDHEMRIQGPAAGRVQARYDATWNWMAGLESAADYGSLFGDSHAKRRHPNYPPTPIPEEQPGTAEALYFHQQAYWRRSDGDRALEFTVSLVLAAQREIVVYDPYLIPPDGLKAA